MKKKHSSTMLIVKGFIKKTNNGFNLRTNFYKVNLPLIFAELLLFKCNFESNYINL